METSTSGPIGSFPGTWESVFAQEAYQFNASPGSPGILRPPYPNGGSRESTSTQEARMKADITRAMGYVRVSTEEQAREGVSIEAQEERIRALATAKGWSLGDIIREAGYSGKNLNRPGAKALLDICRPAQTSLSSTRSTGSPGTEGFVVSPRGGLRGKRGRLCVRHRGVRHYHSRREGLSRDDRGLCPAGSTRV